MCFPLKDVLKNIQYVKSMYNSMRGFNVFKNNFEIENSNYQQILFSIFIICIINNSKFRNIRA